MFLKNNMLCTKSSHPFKEYSSAEQKQLAKQGFLFIVGMTKDSLYYAEDIHQKLKKYVLTPTQLEDNGFPLSSGSVASTRPGKKCVRCGVTYFTTNGDTNSEVCNFHPGKLSDNENLTYSCCQRPRLSKGCESATHVTRVCDVAFVETQPSVAKPEKSLLVLALDTEMCLTVKGLEVTKLSVVDLFRRSRLVTFIRPRNLIVDYITNYSGVTEKDLRDCTSTLENVQQELLELIHSDTILIGHTLHNDLSVLGLVHKRVVDTSIMFPNTEHPHRKTSLKNLALQILKRRIQDSSKGHDCTEDAITCIDLVMRKICAREPNE